jgi:hypothetical protein
MNRILIVFGIFIFCFYSQCINHKSTEPTISIQVSNIKRITSDDFEHREGALYSVNIDLINNTGSDVSFWSMTSSWKDNWLSNINTFHIYNQGCDNDIPVLRHIETGGKLTYKGIVHVNAKNIKEGEENFGLVLIFENEAYYSEDLFKILSEKYR